MHAHRAPRTAYRTPPAQVGSAHLNLRELLLRGGEISEISPLEISPLELRFVAADGGVLGAISVSISISISASTDALPCLAALAAPPDGAQLEQPRELRGSMAASIAARRRAVEVAGGAAADGGVVYLDASTGLQPLASPTTAGGYSDSPTKPPRRGSIVPPAPPVNLARAAAAIRTEFNLQVSQSGLSVGSSYVSM